MILKFYFDSNWMYKFHMLLLLWNSTQNLNTLTQSQLKWVRGWFFSPVKRKLISLLLCGFYARLDLVRVCQYVFYLLCIYGFFFRLVVEENSVLSNCDYARTKIISFWLIHTLRMLNFSQDEHGQSVLRCQSCCLFFHYPQNIWFE